MEIYVLCRVSAQQVSDGGQSTDDVVLDEDEEELKKALALSRQDMEVEDEEADLRRAIQLSMQGTWRHNDDIISFKYTELSFSCFVGSSDSRIPSESSCVTAGSSETLTAEELRRRRQAYFDRWFYHSIPHQTYLHTDKNIRWIKDCKTSFSSWLCFYSQTEEYNVLCCCVMWLQWLHVNVLCSHRQSQQHTHHDSKPAGKRNIQKEKYHLVHLLSFIYLYLCIFCLKIWHIQSV